MPLAGAVTLVVGQGLLFWYLLKLTRNAKSSSVSFSRDHKGYYDPIDVNVTKELFFTNNPGRVFENTPEKLVKGGVMFRESTILSQDSTIDVDDEVDNAVAPSNSDYLNVIEDSDEEIFNDEVSFRSDESTLVDTDIEDSWIAT
ncbi:hypothetical protein WICANDRAFT_61948 [Wickerhamomyces anomalus NRRL Y-366-8]|uniref:Uncharacterized protein n=1 Tax=Wickerhamomyces anomalus (strain ATCC 58044 / CBS 1984 / NCYC 433 / NRRL Y-366-8) TaxID=683960 RepID=A0A1E3P7I5_WICAA|nr:uncharacterized protein WICANDRAFT_61948 [Wickerhamomyces anomalus NRRL Y-366-8]ODQ61391.1 hypothetical protein WICANDRAFT_61948 [Wickerhamomyces anomalus NRRL Y-366-8]